ncbi:MAG: hypothetical protein ACLS9K_03425 [Lachnospira eligens]
MSELNIIEIEHGISYITPSESPLSSNVVVIEEVMIWLYDVGNHPDVIEHLKEINCDGKNINIVLSHFHLDHIAIWIKYGLWKNDEAQDKGHPQIKDRIKIYQGNILISTLIKVKLYLMICILMLVFISFIYFSFRHVTQKEV